MNLKIGDSVRVTAKYLSEANMDTAYGTLVGKVTHAPKHPDDYLGYYYVDFGADRIAGPLHGPVGVGYYMQHELVKVDEDSTGG